jgi:hypothetical protein
MVKIADVQEEHPVPIGEQSIRNRYDLDMMLYKDLIACILSVRYPWGRLKQQSESNQQVSSLSVIAQRLLEVCAEGFDVLNSVSQDNLELTN